MQPASSETASRRHQIGALDQTALAALATTRIEGAPFRNFGEARHSAVDLGQPIGAMSVCPTRTVPDSILLSSRMRSTTESVGASGATRAAMFCSVSPA